MEVAAGKGLGRGFGVLKIPLHHRVSAHDDFALGATVHRDLLHLVVKDGDVLHLWIGDALTSFDGGLVFGGQIIPFVDPHAFGDMAVGFGQSIDLGDVEPKFPYGFEGRGRRRGASRENLNCSVKVAALIIGRIDDKVQDNWCTAKMRDTMIRNRIVDCFCCDVAAADDRATHDRHHPRVVPTVTVEQWYDL